MPLEKIFIVIFSLQTLSNPRLTAEKTKNKNKKKKKDERKTTFSSNFAGIILAIVRENGGEKVRASAGTDAGAIK